MIEQHPSKAKVLQIDSSATQHDNLPYRIELWAADGAGSVERVLAQAASAPLARAMFNAALTEHPERRITLRRGQRVIADSQD
jgi:hypothetical protein